MRKIIRSLVWLDSAQKDQHDNNYRTVAQERLLNLSASEKKALEFCLDFYQRHGQSPQFQLMFDHFEANNDAEGVTFCEEINAETPYFGGSFVDLFENEVQDQAAADFSQKVGLAKKIATTGATIGPGKGVMVKGVDEAVSYLFSDLRPVPKAVTNAIPAKLKDATKGLKDLYNERKANPAGTYGVMTGYAIYDRAWHGLKKKQLTLLGGFGGHLKSTLMMNMVVNGAVMGGWNMWLGTSEMPADELKFMLAAIHSADPKFSGTGRPLHAQRLMQGALQPAEEDFYDLVWDDLINNPDHGSIRVVDSGEFTTWGSVKQRVIRDHADEEIDCLWIDYLTRLPLDPQYRGMDHTTGVNLTIEDAKRFAMQFDQGVGIPVCTPFQINREGWKSAKANGGRYSKNNFAQYNAAEKEADNMAYIFYDEDEAATSEPKVGLAKARWGAMVYDPVNVYIDPDSRRIFDMTSGMNVQTGHAPTSGGGADDVEL